MKWVIVTGASQGLGEALVRQLLEQPDTYVTAIARSENKALLELSITQQANGSRLVWHSFDLLHTDKLEHLMEQLVKQVPISIDKLESAYLINNAGMVQPIAPAERCSAEEAARNVQLNLIAPMVLTSAFIRLASACQGDKAVLNISSGAGRHPYEGWSSYCSSKAGLDMFTRCVGLEQAHAANPVRVLSIAPGVVDTAMQQVIRSTDPSDFTQHARFVELKEGGQLKTPDEVAVKLLQAMVDPAHATGSLLDVRTLAN